MLRKIPSHFWIVTALILIAALMRLLTNYFSIWNFTPITAMALFSGAAMKDKRMAFLIPLAAMLITDAIIGFYSGVFVVYFALLLITLFGLILRNRIKVMPVILGSLGASVIFYLVTNFALFYPTWLYPHSITGIQDARKNRKKGSRYRRRQCRDGFCPRGAEAWRRRGHDSLQAQREGNAGTS